ncbi:MAG: site-specific DNA-methyltransferase [Desulfococcaceae bacterium]|jgi:DNA modification methylase|nr:site-specific DNA-methyltransferase [Desulfococcaceae bacterium]
MKTKHHIYFADAKDMSALSSESIDLVVTSPPYPMIAMWDDLFTQCNPEIGSLLDRNMGMQAFEMMHRELDAVWTEVCRVLKKGGFACINIGDATRTVGGDFALYPNHARIISRMQALGMTFLPEILWRKQTNAPNKFMGAGMLPAGAYVTLEHEYILIFRKGGKREFTTAAEKKQRRQSAFFWEERNTWFSDVWMDIKGSGQDIPAPSDEFRNMRKRSGAFPFEIPFRLIHMYSLQGDTVLDPFLGCGTTLSAAIVSCRNSVGYELEKGFGPLISAACENLLPFARQRIDSRMENHREFLKKREAEKGKLKYMNVHFHLRVMTAQEQDLLFYEAVQIKKCGENKYEAAYRPYSDWPF